MKVVPNDNFKFGDESHTRSICKCYQNICLALYAMWEETIIM